MTRTYDRRIQLRGSANFRDVGGYATRDGRTVRWKRLFRSDGLSRLTDSDLQVLQPFALATLIDLRSPRELEESGPSPLVSKLGAHHVHVPFLQDTPDAEDLSLVPPLAELYEQMLETGAPTISSVFEALAEDTTYPAVVHCAAGKDRTGVTIALVLRALHVADHEIVADYALTDQYHAEFMKLMRASGKGSRYEGIPDYVMRAEAETMVGLLAVLDDRFGGTETFLASCGVPNDALQTMQHLLLE
jgi:protein tyrosine/serine phosphatase